MLNLSVAIVCGRPARYNHDMRCWEPSNVWRVILAEHPYRVIAIPAFAVANELHAGDMDCVVELRDCSWTRDFEQELWREQIAKERT